MGNYDSIREKIIYNADIIAVISEYITLKRAGANYKAKCPFHNEKTASLIISPAKQIFHCFGCGIGGSVVEFVQKIGSYSYMETIEYLCEKLGIEFTRKDNVKKETRDILLEINLKSLDFYKNELKKNIDAYKYIRKRGVTDETIALFGIGYAPNQWDAAKNWLSGQKFRDDTLVEAGLVIKRDDSVCYDRFRNRIMFPIFDIAGKPIAFGGRAMDDNESAKYLNSPETPVYHKGNALYGLNLSKQYIKNEDRVFILEGYMDLIICFQAGIKNVVATLGTALTPAQIRLLTRYTKNLTLVFDGDNAGINAMARSVEKMLELEVYPDVFVIEDEFDPAEIILAKGSDYFLRKLEKPQSFFNFMLEKLLKEHNVSDLKGKQTVIAEMLKILKFINDNIAFSEYIKVLSENLRVDFNSLMEEAKKKIRILKSRAYSGNTSEPADTIITSEINKNSDLRELEAKILKYMVEFNTADIIDFFKKNIQPSELKEPFDIIIERIFETMDADVHKLSGYFDGKDHIKTLLTTISLQPQDYSSEDSEKVMNDYIFLHKSRKFDQSYEDIKSSLKKINLQEESDSRVKPLNDDNNADSDIGILLQKQLELKKTKLRKII